MAGATPKELGELIFKANPYKLKPADREPDGNEVQLDGGIEADEYGLTWAFRGGSFRIAKVLRIPYTYKDKHGVKVRDYLWIGYEGAGGH
jgi:hypothetical protein